MELIGFPTSFFLEFCDMLSDIFIASFPPILTWFLYCYLKACNNDDERVKELNFNHRGNGLTDFKEAPLDFFVNIVEQTKNVPTVGIRDEETQ